MTSVQDPSPPDQQDTNDNLLAALRGEDAQFPSSGAIAVGLMCAALGAGLGWVASRSVRRGARSTARAEAIERGLRELRRAARRATRRVG